jgi:hypothetical protein
MFLKEDFKNITSEIAFFMIAKLSYCLFNNTLHFLCFSSHFVLEKYSFNELSVFIKVLSG